LIRDFGATVVHLNSGFSPQLYGLMACRLMGGRCVVSYRGYEYPSRLIRPLRTLVDRFIVCSKPVKSHIVNVLKIPEEKISYIYDPVDTDAFSPDVPPADLGHLFAVPRGQKVFAIFGRLVPWKGHEVFLKAARMVLDAVPEAHAMIVGDTADGDPAYGEVLRGLSRELGIEGRVSFTGYRSDIAPLMRACQVLVHASIEAEPFGTVILEGMACGRPYVAMDEGGPPEMIDSGTHGFLIRPNQPEAMAQAIITLLTQPETAAAFGSAARARCLKRFSAPTIAKQHLELYREVACCKLARNAATSHAR
jgi:glycosyltransferase involved in cell wall biosynthesis